MNGYSLERKAAVLKKWLPPYNRCVMELSRAEGTSDVTLYTWCRQALVLAAAPLVLRKKLNALWGDDGDS